MPKFSPSPSPASTFIGLPHSAHLAASVTAGAPADVGRRRLLQTVLGASTVWAAPMLWAQTSDPLANANNSTNNARLVVVFLRGAYDGLSALVPYADPNYYRLRPTIALPVPDGSAQTTLKLDKTFGLNPALAPLLPLWQQKKLAKL